MKKYSNTLKKIIIINPTWHINTTLNLLWPILDEKLKSIIIVHENIENDKNIKKYYNYLNNI